MKFCIIPKGAKFYIGRRGDIVSDELIVCENKPLHAYKYRQACIHELKYPNNNMIWNIAKPCICECIIPKGAQYYIGMHHDIVSNKLIMHATKEWNSIKAYNHSIVNHF